jgi:hypothetical protein
MACKYDAETIKNIIKNKGYTLLTNQKITTNNTFDLVDGVGYKYQTKLETLINTASRKFDKRNKYTIDNIKIWLGQNSKLILLSENYVDNITRLKKELEI